MALSMFFEAFRKSLDRTLLEQVRLVKKEIEDWSNV